MWKAVEKNALPREVLEKRVAFRKAVVWKVVFREVAV